MSEDLKYYIPRINEFYLGFEFECRELSWNTKEYSDWKLEIDPLNMDYNGFADTSPYYWMDLTNDNRIQFRVKYLDQFDIESLGWKFSDKIILQASNGTEFQLAFIVDKHWIGIYNTTLQQGVFNGEIKNKSELKKLMKQLGIN